MFNYYLAKGTKGIISYHTQIDSIDNTTYKLNCPRQIQNIAISNLLEFTNNHVPKFGKYEVEEFVAEMILIAIAEHDITKLMNTEISFDDSPYDKGFYPKERGKRVDTKLLHYNIRKKWYCRTKLYWKTNF